MITTHWVRTRETRPLNIFGPIGTTRFVDRQLLALEDDIGSRVEHHADVYVQTVLCNDVVRAALARNCEFD